MNSGRIRALAICVIRREDELLVFEAHDSVKDETSTGSPGHELVRVYEGRFADSADYKQGTWRVRGVDRGNQGSVPFVWKSLIHFRESNASLYPDGLLQLLDPA